jgi:hypothetical protein
MDCAEVDQEKIAAAFNDDTRLLLMQGACDANVCRAWAGTIKLKNTTKRYDNSRKPTSVIQKPKTPSLPSTDPSSILLSPLIASSLRDLSIERETPQNEAQYACATSYTITQMDAGITTCRMGY